jgi:hypothetical protein
MSENTSVATPSRTGIASTSRRTRNRIKAAQPCHQLRQTLAGDPQIYRRARAAATGSKQRGTNEAFVKDATRGIQAAALIRDGRTKL